MAIIQTKLLILDRDIAVSEIPSFRGAVLNALPNNCSPMFHNHTSDDSLCYSYPKVQYKSIKGKAAVLCIGDGCSQMDHLHSLNGVELKLPGKKFMFRTFRFVTAESELEVSKNIRKFRITDWIALNSANYSAYRQMLTATDKIHFLETILIGNILSFAKGLHINIEKEIICRITDFPTSRIVTVKGVAVNAFDVEFVTNVSLPDHIGLGRHASFGFGVVYGSEDNQ